MTQPSRNITVTLRSADLALVAAEADRGFLPVRTPTGVVSFFPVGDSLEGRASQAQADYLGRIEGFEVEGQTPKPESRPAVEDWFREGERLLRARQQTEQPTAPATDPMALFISLLGGPEQVQAILQAAVARQGGQIVQAAQQQEEDRRAEAERLRAEREARAGWSFFKLQGKVSSEVATELLTEFDPAYVSDGKHANALLSRVASLANENHVLSDRLAELVK